MTLLQAIFLGALQGITEFLPVSSSGHLVIARQFLDINEVPILFDVLLHIATLAAVAVVFRTRIVAMLAALLRIGHPEPTDEDRTNRRLMLWILVASVCTGVLGVVFSRFDIEAVPRVVSVLFVVTGIMLIFSRKWHGSVDYSSVGLKQALITGIAQGFGVFPGISRSGITISAALFGGMKRENAGEFAFLLAIPAIVGALALKLGEADELMRVISPLGLTAGILVAFGVGLLSLVLLLRLVQKGKLYVFAVYLIPLGIITFFLL